MKRSPDDGIRAAFAQLALAQATLVANQAALVDQMNRTHRTMEEIRRKEDEVRREATERFLHIESLLLTLLELLPEALREKIGIRKK